MAHEPMPQAKGPVHRPRQCRRRLAGLCRGVSAPAALAPGNHCCHCNHCNHYSAPEQRQLMILTGLPGAGSWPPP